MPAPPAPWSGDRSAGRRRRARGHPDRPDGPKRSDRVAHVCRDGVDLNHGNFLLPCTNHYADAPPLPVDTDDDGVHDRLCWVTWYSPRDEFQPTGHGRLPRHHGGPSDQRMEPHHGARRVTTTTRLPLHHRFGSTWMPMDPRSCLLCLGVNCIASTEIQGHQRTSRRREDCSPTLHLLRPRYDGRRRSPRHPD